MTKLSHILLLLGFTFTLVAWSPVSDTTTTQTDLVPLAPISDRNDYEQRRRNQNTDRDDIIRETKKQYSGEDICEDLDKRDRKDCERICSDIYRRRGDKKECEELKVDLIEDLEKLYKALKYRDSNNFEDIAPELFDTYLNVGLSGFTDIIKNYSSKEAKEFLLWLIENPDISNIFIKEDDDYKILIKLFKAIDSDYNEEDKTWSIFDENILLTNEEPTYKVNPNKKSNTIYNEKDKTWSIFDENILLTDEEPTYKVNPNKKGNTMTDDFNTLVKRNVEIEFKYNYYYLKDLMTLILESGSEEIMDWFLSYINDINTECDDDTESEACFEVYCKIGQRLSSEQQKIWHEDENFYDFLDDIVSKKVNQANWKFNSVRSGGDKEDDIEDLDYLLDEKISNDTWVDALCAGLITT